MPIIIHMSSLVLFIYPIMYNLSFCTLSVQMHIVHVICMLSTLVHIICLSSLPILIYLIIHNLVSTHCLHTCISSMSSVYCLEMHICYVHVISTAVICICTCHLHTIWAYMYYVHIICSGP